MITMMWLLCMARPSPFAVGSVHAVVAQPLDLVGDVDALIGDDPLQHPHPLLQPLGVGGILRGLLGGLRR